MFIAVHTQVVIYIKWVPFNRERDKILLEKYDQLLTRYVAVCYTKKHLLRNNENQKTKPRNKSTM